MPGNFYLENSKNKVLTSKALRHNNTKKTDQSDNGHVTRIQAKVQNEIAESAFQYTYFRFQAS